MVQILLRASSLEALWNQLKSFFLSVRWKEHVHTLRILVLLKTIKFLEKCVIDTMHCISNSRENNAIPSSSVAEPPTVNRLVAGSNPALGVTDWNTSVLTSPREKRIGIQPAWERGGNPLEPVSVILQDITDALLLA